MKYYNYKTQSQIKAEHRVNVILASMVSFTIGFAICLTILAPYVKGFHHV